MNRIALLALLLSSSLSFATNAPPVCDVDCSPDPVAGGNSYVLARTYPVNDRGRSTSLRPIHHSPPQTVQNIGSQSYNYAIPMVHLPGRNHLDLDLTLYYNSAVWSMDTPNAGANFNADRDWPSYGFRLDFGLIESGFDQNGGNMYVLTQPDGTKHQLEYTLDSTNHITNVYKSLDSSYITYNNSTRVLTYKNGTRVFYAAYPSQGTSPYDFRPTKIEDSNGNFITINYVAGHDQAISSVVDTVGRTILFNYNTSGELQSLTNPAGNPAADQGPSTYATFQWGTKYGSGYVWYRFKAPFLSYTAPAFTNPLNVLLGCQYPNQTGYTFTYGDWGIINQISKYGSNGATAVETYVRYD